MTPLKDWHTSARRQFLRRDEKLHDAIAWMGTRWLLHPTNAPRKGRYDEREMPRYFKDRRDL